MKASGRHTCVRASSFRRSNGGIVLPQHDDSVSIPRKLTNETRSRRRSREYAESLLANMQRARNHANILLQMHYSQAAGRVERTIPHAFG